MADERNKGRENECFAAGSGGLWLWLQVLVLVGERRRKRRRRYGKGQKVREKRPKQRESTVGSMVRTVAEQREEKGKKPERGKGRKVEDRTSQGVQGRERKHPSMEGKGGVDWGTRGVYRVQAAKPWDWLGSGAVCLLEWRLPRLRQGTCDPETIWAFTAPAGEFTAHLDCE
jgi:hypothetical protein